MFGLPFRTEAFTNYLLSVHQPPPTQVLHDRLGAPLKLPPGYSHLFFLLNIPDICVPRVSSSSLYPVSKILKLAKASAYPCPDTT